MRDNTNPNRGNGLASTDEGAAEALLSFADNETVYDKTVTGYNPNTTSGGFSRFFAAQQSLPLSYKLNDTGICTGTDYALCNAGIDTVSAPKIKIEDANDKTGRPVFWAFANRFVNTGSQTKHFDKVCTDTICDIVTDGNYRDYEMQLESAGNRANKLCDYVGNCIESKLQFRVVANTINSATSNLSIASNSTTADGKIIANGNNTYKLSYALKDAHGNQVVPVKSLENAGTPIKSVETAATFVNGLNENQLKNSGGIGTKLVTATNLRPGVVTVTSAANSINSDGIIAMTEATTGGPTGVYELALSSKVPTQAAYPYLSDRAKLAVTSINNDTTKINAPANITYPKTGADRLGYGTLTATAGTSAPFSVIDKGGIGESEGFKNIILNEANYGKVTYASANAVPFVNLATRYPNFEFASPYVYGLNGMQVLIDGQYGDHYKKLYTIDSSVPNYNIYEKYVVAYNTDKDEQPGVLDYKIRKSASDAVVDISPGVRYTGNGNLPIFGPSMVVQPYDIKGAGGSGYFAEVQMNTRADRMPYDTTKLRTGFVSALTYEAVGNIIQLPSVGRGLTQMDGETPLDQYASTRNYFDDTYTIGKAGLVTPTTLTVNIDGVGIIGLTNRYNTLTTDTGGTQKNVEVETELNRTTLIASIKQNVANLSRGLGTKTSTAAKRWCIGGTINLETTDLSACTVTNGGESLIFIDGNTTIECSNANNTCKVDSRKSLIVKNGSLYLKSNISTLTTA